MKRRDAAREFGITMGSSNSEKKAIRHRMATAEHIIPVSLGGKHGASNIAMSCQLCNSSRSSEISAFNPHPEVIHLLPKEVRKALSNALLHGGLPHD